MSLKVPLKKPEWSRGYAAGKRAAAQCVCACEWSEDGQDVVSLCGAHEAFVEHEIGRGIWALLKSAGKKPRRLTPDWLAEQSTDYT